MSPGVRRAALVLLALVIVVGITFALLQGRHRAAATPPTELIMRSVTVGVDPRGAALVLRDPAHTWERTLVLRAVVDGQAHALEFAASPVVAGTNLDVKAHVDLDGTPLDATVSLSAQPEADVVVATLAIPSLATGESHTVALRAELSTAGRSAFLSGVGEIADLGTNKGRFLLVDAERFTIGFVSPRGDLDVAAVVEEADEIGSPMELAITGPSEKAVERADLRLAVGPSSRVVGLLYRLEGAHTLHVHGLVTGLLKTARVYGLDAAGVPAVRVDAEPDGHFALGVPNTVVEWYAALGSSLTSTPIRFIPGTQSELTARIIVRGEGETLDPSFGPDYRATGAGPLIDTLHGEVETPLPEGHYRVAATKGLEWSIDAQSIVVASGRTVDVNLALRHVVPSDGVIDCDLHVHARPSFDSPVTAEDRVLSLVAAGIDFAVPSEHNVVGDYAPALATLDLTRQLSTVTGVEVTTYTPRFGHFGVFPYPKGPVPPYKGTTAAQVFQAAHRDPSRILQVNHPRLPKAIGYFEVMHFDPNAPHPPARMRTDFDTIEVYNGFDGNEPLRVDAVLHDWYSLLNQGFHYVATGSSDSHRIQYQWAGYPRTMVTIPITAPVDEALGVDPLAVVSSLKKGHAFVTSGPVIDLEIDGMHSGEEAAALDGRVHAHITVRAAPWIDVTSLDVIVAGRVALTIPIPSHATITGPETGTLAEAQLRTLRLEETIPIDVGAAENWILIVARGSRPLNDVLPYMPIPPMAFTNPIWLIRDPASFFGPPRPRRR